MPIRLYFDHSFTCHHLTQCIQLQIINQVYQSQQSYYYTSLKDLQRFFYNISIHLMKQAVSSFQQFFFQYQIPAPFSSLFLQDIIKSNDLRLLLEIATRSILRMYTDTKTGNLHFICKQRGPQCFDIEAQPHPIHNGYYFNFDYLRVKHRGNCHQEREAFEYLKIYNLMKLKKKLIEDYMIKLKLERQSPSVILFRLSNKTEEYFFEKYLNGHIELKRKLRKRFDNIVNIDIKRIGKFQEDEEREMPKITSRTSKARRLRLMKERAKMKMLNKRIVEVKVQVDAERQKEEIQAMQQQHRFLKLRRFKASKKNKKKKKSKQIYKQHIKIETQPFPEIFVKKEEEESIFEQTQHQMIKQEVLPEIMVLNEQAQYIWSQSQDSSVEQMPELQVANHEDYFKSLRNSTLKHSLERQSLNFCFFSRDSTRDNKQNTL